MQIKVTKLTDLKLMQKACEATMHGAKSNVSLRDIYRCEHSPIRTSLFWVELIDIPTFASVHLTRHKIGVEHYVTSNRDDRGGDGEETRWTPVNHSLLINAQALINMSRKRLCGKAHVMVQGIMADIREEVKTCDPDLAEFMVRECQYRGGHCFEFKPCGNLWQPESVKPPEANRMGA